MERERTHRCFIGRRCQLLRLFSVIVRRVGMEHGWNVSVRGNETNSEKTSPMVNLSTINPTWTGLESKSGLRCEKPATIRWRHDTTPLIEYAFIEQ